MFAIFCLKYTSKESVWNGPIIHFSLMSNKIMLMGYCNFRVHRISYTTEFLQQIWLAVKLWNSTTGICATRIEELKASCMCFNSVFEMKLGGATLKDPVSNRNYKAWHFPDLLHYLQHSLLPLNYQLGKCGLASWCLGSEWSLGEPNTAVAHATLQVSVGTLIYVSCLSLSNCTVLR